MLVCSGRVGSNEPGYHGTGLLTSSCCVFAATWTRPRHGPTRPPTWNTSPSPWQREMLQLPGSPRLSAWGRDLRMQPLWVCEHPVSSATSRMDNWPALMFSGLRELVMVMQLVVEVIQMKRVGCLATLEWLECAPGVFGSVMLRLSGLVFRFVFGCCGHAWLIGVCSLSVSWVLATLQWFECGQGVFGSVMEWFECSCLCLAVMVTLGWCECV